MILQERDIQFNFSDAINACKFDDEKTHGLSYCMKSVDFIVELQDRYLFVEVKDPNNPNAQSQAVQDFKQKCTSGELRNDLKAKFRDTFIYKWAEKTQDKPIYYLCLITLDDVLLLTLNDDLKKHLPIASVPQKWSRSIAQACHMLNIASWNKIFPQWQVTRL